MLYKCFRVKCQAKGFISSLPGTTRIDLPDKKKAFKPREFKHDLSLLTDDVYAWLYNNYSITREEADYEGFRLETKYGRIYMPTFDKLGEQYGAVTKAIERRAGIPKTFTYNFRDTSRIHYPRGGIQRNEPLCVVEDILSAVRVSRFVKACALLGTTINNEKISELRTISRQIIMLLDNDAFRVALKARKLYGFYFNKFVVLVPDKDPKDMSHEELGELLSDYTIRGAGARN